MAAQILGSLVSVAGILWFIFTVTPSGADFTGQHQPVLSLLGVVGFVGGLLLWALGRIECAVKPPTPEQRKWAWIVSMLLLVLIMVVVFVSIALSSAMMAKQQQNEHLERERKALEELEKVKQREKAVKQQGDK